MPVNPLGVSGEALAEDHLRGLGYQIIEKDVRTPLGQLDLVAMDGKTLVFVEVRLRRSQAFGGAAESITATKRRRLRLAAQHYLLGIAREPPCRFDAILLDGLGAGNIEWLRGIDID